MQSFKFSDIFKTKGLRFSGRYSLYKDLKAKVGNLLAVVGYPVLIYFVASLFMPLDPIYPRGTVCITAQHRHMLDQVLHVFEIEPDYDLDIMRQGQTLSDITTAALSGLENVLKQIRPDIVLVHGDTTTTFAGALAAFYQQVSVGHVEAGLRTWNKYSPFPEEMNRQMVDCVTDLYFAPTEQSKQNLLDENRDPAKIYVTGNTAIDALKTTVREDYRHPVLDWCGDSRLILLTAHRRENLGEPMRRIFRAVRRIINETPDIQRHMRYGKATAHLQFYL